MKMTSRLSRIATSLTLSAAVFGSTAAMAAPVENVVLVHGYFADGSGRQAVAKILTRDGYKVSVVQKPETSFADDVVVRRNSGNPESLPSKDGARKLTDLCPLSPA